MGGGVYFILGWSWNDGEEVSLIIFLLESI